MNSPTKARQQVGAIELGFDEQHVANQVIEKLGSRGDIFDFCGSLAAVCKDSATPDRKIIRRLPQASLREAISASCVFVAVPTERSPQNEQNSRQRVPRWLVEAVERRGHWPGLPVLRGVVHSPVLRPDGSILQSSGFDPDSGLFVDLRGKFPAIPTNPSRKAIDEAREKLKDLVSDFCFAKQEHQAAWVASLLTVLAREAHDGATGPLFLIDANTRGSGKSLLADLSSLIVSGCAAVRMPHTHNDDEFRKRITALAANGERLVLVDNIDGKFGSASLDAALTGTVWKDRRLGHTELVEAPLRMTWLASGNNTILAADTARRTCHIRLQSDLESPEDRHGFKYPDIQQHVLRHRGEYLGAALVILRGYVAAKRPDQRLKPWGSFEQWSDLVRSAVVWCGLPDPGETRDELRQTSDSEAESLRQALEVVLRMDEGRHGLSTNELLKIAGGQTSGFGAEECGELRDALEMLCDSAGRRLTSRELGNRLRHFKSRVVGGKCFDFRTSRGNRLWFVRDCGGGSGVSGGSVLADRQFPVKVAEFEELPTDSHHSHHSHHGDEWDSVLPTTKG